MFLAAVIFLSSPSYAQLLNDPGFELDQPTGQFPTSGYWTSSWFPPEAGAVVTTTAAYSGSNGLWAYTASTASSSWTGIYQQITANPGDVITASAAIRTPASASWASGSFACVRVEFLSSANSVISYQDSNKLTSPNTGWQAYSLTASPAPAGTAKVRYRLYLEKPASGSAGQSIANFDEASLTKTEGIPQLYLSKYAVGISKDLSQQNFTIKNIGNGALDYTFSESIDWLSLSESSGSLISGSEKNITISASRALCNNETCYGAINLNTNGGNQVIKAYLEKKLSTVPNLPSIAYVSQNKLVVKKRLMDGSLGNPVFYNIKGVAWSPASIGTAGDITSRRNEFRKWYVADAQLFKEMNANTVYTFLDFFASPDALSILDNLYKNGIMAIVTVDEDGTNSLSAIDSIVPYYKNHPAILMWAIGNEWNINYYHGKYSGLDQSAAATQSAAQRIKGLDSNHPVASIYGEIDIPGNGQPLSKTQDIVNNVASAVDVWGVNAYRGDTFGTLFDQWKSITSKPMFLSEYGTDSYYTSSYYPVVGYEDEAMQANFNHKLWQEIRNNLAGYDNSKVSLGGTIFEANDEWWKVKQSDGGSINSRDNGGFATYWNPYAHPDGFGNEEYFGIISIERKPKSSYSLFKDDFSNVSNTETDILKFNISLAAGWNLISIPLNLANSILPGPLRSIEGNYSGVYTYSGKWIELINGSKINETIGIWIKMLRNDTLVVEGTEIKNPSVSIKQGSNIIGYPFLNESNPPDFFNGMNISIVFSYNGTWSSYSPNRASSLNKLKAMKPGYGYWVKKG